MATSPIPVPASVHQLAVSWIELLQVRMSGNSDHGSLWQEVDAIKASRSENYPPEYADDDMFVYLMEETAGISGYIGTDNLQTPNLARADLIGLASNQTLFKHTLGLLKQIPTYDDYPIKLVAEDTRRGLLAHLLLQRVLSEAISDLQFSSIAVLRCPDDDYPQAQLGWRTIGEVMGITESAAKMRFGRQVQKLLWRRARNTSRRRLK